MMKSMSRIVLISLLNALMVSLIPLRVHAQLGSISIIPGQIVNDVDTVITVTGTGFKVGTSVVMLEGYGALDTTLQNETILTALVKAGIAPRIYTVNVSTGPESVSCTDWVSTTR